MKRPKLNMKTFFFTCIFVCLAAAAAWAQAPGQVVKAKVTMASQVARPRFHRQGGGGGGGPPRLPHQ